MKLPTIPNESLTCIVSTLCLLMRGFASLHNSALNKNSNLFPSQFVHFVRWMNQMTRRKHSFIVMNKFKQESHEHASQNRARCIPQISINCKMLSYQYGPTFLKNAFSSLLNQCHVELRQFWSWKGVKH